MNLIVIVVVTILLLSSHNPTRISIPEVRFTITVENRNSVCVINGCELEQKRNIEECFMAVSLPYLVSNKNVPALFEKIASAKVPDNFNREFLQTTIGLKASNDRALIPLLRNFGFIEQSGAPTNNYRLLKGDRSRAVLADGIRKAYQPLFDADQEANKLASEKLKSLVSQVAGTDDDLTGRIASTFSTLVKIADFDSPSLPKSDEGSKHEKADGVSSHNDAEEHVEIPKPKGLRTEFHYNIQVHLPSNGTEEVYLNIFNALRKTFQ